MQLISNLAFFDRTAVVVSLGGGARRLILSCYEFEDCGLQCCWLDERATLETLLGRLELSFRTTGGVPDHLALKPLRPLTKPNSREWSASFERFCRHFRVLPVEGVWPRAATRDALTWLNARTHDSLQSCQEALSHFAAPQQTGSAGHPLPATPFVSDHDCFRRVAGDGFILCGGDAYSVPDRYCGKNVWLQIRNQQLIVRSQEGRQLAIHQAGDGTGRVIMDIAHFESTRARLSRDIRCLERAFRARFPEHERFLHGILAQRKQAAAAALRAILAFIAHHSSSNLSKAFERALYYNNFSPRFIEGLLTVKAHTVFPPSCTEQGTLF